MAKRVVVKEQVVAEVIDDRGRERDRDRGRDRDRDGDDDDDDYDDRGPGRGRGDARDRDDRGRRPWIPAADIDVMVLGTAPGMAEAQLLVALLQSVANAAHFAATQQASSHTLSHSSTAKAVASLYEGNSALEVLRELVKGK
jgi:hypothetical protein